MLIQKFEDLPIWRLALKITKLVYDISAKEKFAKDFGLRDQIRRSTVSISSNIVEGYEKSNNNEFMRFLKIAK
jgi:four helix bundle protein